MGIDVGFCAGETLGEDEELVDMQPLASVPEFFNMAQLLGMIMEPIRNIDQQEITEAMTTFDTYINEDRPGAEQQFTRYCEFTSQALKAMMQQMQEKASGEEPVNLTEDNFNVDPDDFHPDVRAFLGKFALSDRVIAPTLARSISPFAGLACGMFSAWRSQVETDQPELADALGNAYECMETIGNYCDRSVDEERFFCFSV